MNDAVTTEPAAAPVSEPTVPWDAAEIVILLILVLILWPSLVLDLLQRTGFFAWYYPGETAQNTERQGLWFRALAFPFQAATIPVFLALLHGVRPAALGLSSDRLGRNLRLGLGWATILTPMVYGMHLGIVWIYTHVLGVAEKKHPLTVLSGMNLSRLEWGLWLFVAIIAAPVLEELLFRGLFQPWAGKNRWNGAAGIAIAAIISVVGRLDEIAAAARQVPLAGWGAVPHLLDAFAPLLFVLALLPVFFVTIQRSRSPAGPAILCTALFFALVHVGVWPSPIALFLLALGLGWLKERTHSLVGPIVVHGLFNAASCALILFGLT